MITLWSIWKNKNERMWNNQGISTSIIAISSQYLHQWLSVRGPSITSHLQNLFWYQLTHRKIGQPSNKLNNKTISHRNKFLQTYENLWRAPIKYRTQNRIKRQEDETPKYKIENVKHLSSSPNIVLTTGQFKIWRA